MNLRTAIRLGLAVLALLVCAAIALWSPAAPTARALAWLAVGLLLAWLYLERRLTGRIRRLNAALQDLVAGKTFATDETGAPDEIGNLSANLSQLLERLQAQSTQLEDGLARYRRAWDSSLVGAFFWEGEGRLTEANDALLTLTGLSREQIAAGNVLWPSLLAREYVQEAQWAVAELKTQGRCAPFDTELVRADGARTPVRCEVAAFAGAAGRGVGFLLDLSQHEAAETAYRSSAHRLRSIWEKSVDGMRLTDRNGIVLAVNQSYCGLVEMPSVELVGQPFTMAYAAGSDREHLLAEYLQRFEKRPIDNYVQTEVTLRSGKKLDLEFIYSVIELPRGEPLYLSIVRDITSRKQVERTLRAQQEEQQIIFDSVPAMIWYQDANGKILRANQPAARAFGWAVEQIEGRTWDDLNPEQAARHRAEDLKVIQSGQPVLGQVEILRTASGQTRHLAMDRVPYRDDQGRVIGVIVLAQDITERQAAETGRLEMERKLLEMQRLESLGVMAGGIAHDFNNLLTAILGNASLGMMQLPESAPTHSYFQNIEKSSLQAADLCKKMLAYSGRGRFVLQHLDLNCVVQDTAHLVQPSLAKNIQVKHELAAYLPGVEGDPAQIQQVLMNLIANAAEAIGDKKGVITIRTGHVEADQTYLAGTYLSPEVPEGPYAYFEIADTGMGMSADTQARIFDPFFTTKFAGRGLGLAAVWGIIRGHRGALKLESEVGRGTTFRVLLPCAKTTPGTQKPPLPPGLWQGTGTILLVDDEESVRSVTARMLESFGFGVLSASDGQHGVEAFRQYGDDITLVMLDLSMPEMSGEEAFEEIRRIRPDARVVLISGRDEGEIARRFAGKGLAGFVQKPFKPQTLNRKLQAIFEPASTPDGVPIKK